MNPSRPPILLSLLTVCGLILAALSFTDLCNFGGCTVAHEYRFFGQHFALIGLTYFGLVAAAILLTVIFEKAGGLTSLLLAGGAGAELIMIHLQKDVIGAWCPLCLGIAVIVYLLCILRMLQALPESRRLFTMNRRRFFLKTAIIVAAAVIGLCTGIFGINRPEAATSQTDYALGKSNSKVEVYVFSDWLCPICVKVEPAIESTIPALEKKAKIYFVDKPVHQEAMNFVPYHLSFLVHEKPKYIQLRKALFNLASKNRNPSLEDVKHAVSPLGVTYKQLSFMEVSQIMGRFQALSTQFKVSGTPTVVVYNTVTKKSKSLVGGNSITQENLIKTVKSLE